MKKKKSIIGFCLGLLVFLALITQSIHSLHHFKEALTSKKCHHDDSKNKSQITHRHGIERCFACEFVFSSIVNSFDKTIDLTVISIDRALSLFFISDNISFFNGSSFLLRGPPVL